MMRALAFSLALMLMSAAPTMADEDLVSGISQDVIQITSSYTGTDIVVFGAIERAVSSSNRDIVVMVRGPDTDLTVRRRDRIAGIWINHDAAKFEGLPAYYFLASTRPLSAIASPSLLERYGLGAAHLKPTVITSHHDPEPFRRAAIRQLEAKGLYTEAPGGIDFLSETLFRARVPVPAGVARGQYSVDVYLIRNGEVVAAQSTPFFIDQSGLERRLSDFARGSALLYGLTAVFMALLLGWATSVLMKLPG
jgi:uncharacterized protein (TIGR02186 family)